MFRAGQLNRNCIMLHSFSYGHVFLAVFACSWLCDASFAIPTFQSFIDINKDGSIDAKTQMPACDSGRKIQIIKAMSHKRLCNSLCFRVTTENISPEIEDRLYEMCSYKEICTRLEFSPTSIEHDNITGVDVSYQCLDSKSVVDICKGAAVFFTSDSHLIGTVPMNRPKECRCFAQGGKFRIAITDLRLASKLERNCSSITLTIQSKKYDCSTPDYKNIFNQTVDSSVTGAFISLTSSAIEPSTAKMVWITLQPEGSSQYSIQCSSFPRNTSTTNSTSQHKNTSDSTNQAAQSVSAIPGKEMPSEDQGGGVGIGISVTIVVSACLGIGMYCFLKRRKQRANGSSKIEPSLMGTTTTMLPLHGNNRCATEQQSIENIYSFIKHDQMNSMANFVDDTEYDKTGNAAKTVRKDLHYNHLSSIVKSSFSDTLEGVLSKRDTSQYSFAKDVKD